MCFFTVFTPTYNRAYILPKLYKSLKQQNMKDFEWLIIDDGSQDNTEKLIRTWMNENIVQIHYHKKQNGGKPRAINYGIKYAKGKFFFMVDSDDFLCEDALEKMKIWCEEIKDIHQIIGVGAAKGYPDGKYIKGVAPLVNEKGYVDANNLERKKYNLDADMCEAYKTEIFKKFPMAEWENEKFAPEQIALNEIALAGYKVRWHDDIIYTCEYLPDGLTKGSFSLEKNNPMGYSMMYNHMLKYYTLTKKEKYYAACQHIALAIYGKKISYILKTNNWLYTILAMPVGIILSVRRKKQFRED